MSALAHTMQAFFTDRLARQRHASPETVAAYRDALRLLVGFASERVGKEPSQLDIAELDAREQRAHTECPPGSSPLVVPLCGASAP